MKQKLILGAFAVAAFLPNFFPALPPLLFWAPFAMALALVSVYLGKYWILSLIAGLSFGLFSASSYQEKLLAAEYDSGIFTLFAHVAEIENRSNGSQRMELNVERIWLPDGVLLDPHPKKILLSWYGERKLEAGSRIEAEVKLRRPRGLQNPGLFDYQRWLVAQGFGATGYIRDLLKAEASSTEYSWFTRWRSERQAAITQHSDFRFPGVHQALSLGDGSMIQQNTWALFRNTGTVHLMVISGLHVGLMTGLGYVFGFGIGRCLSAMFGWNAVRVGIVSALSLAFIYAAISGFGLPAKRAIVMLICLLVPRYLYLKVSPWLSFFLALAIVAVLEPRAVLQSGFWLSFGAVALLFLAFFGNSRQRFLTTLMRSQVLFFVCFSGVLLWQGLPSPTVSIFANLMAVPLVSLVIAPLEVLALSTSMFSSALAIEVWMLCDSLVAWMIGLLQWLTDLDFPPLARPANWTWLHGLAVLGTFLIFAVPNIRLRLALVVSWLVLLFPMLENDYLLKLRVFDVGQGTSILIQQPGYNLLYDTGPKFSESFDSGADIISPTLVQQDISEIDHLIVSHPDADHRAGLEGVLDQHSVRRFDVGKFIDLRKSPYPQNLCVAGDSWVIGEVVYRYLWPDSDRPSTNNDSSCVLAIESGDLRILIPGDISSSAERKLLQQLDFLENTDVLIVPHHGSNTSSSLGFLKALSPEWAVVSAGYQNQFNHPHPDVLGRYHSIGSTVLNTANSGAIEFHWKSPETVPKVTRATESKIFWWQK